MKTYKGFDKDLKCRGFQYEIGKEYETDTAKACESGFHACENPLDVFNYCPPADSRYCEVEQSGEIDKDSDDSKIASTKIKIGAEIGLSGLIKAGVNFILEHAKSQERNTGDRSAATNTGYRSAATNTGYRSAATNTGDYSAATNTGNCSAATNTGDRSAATNTGDRSAATNTGYRSAATNTGDYSAATVGKGDSVAIATGYQSKARAGLGSAIVLCERGEWNGSTYPLINIKTAIIDGEKLKADNATVRTFTFPSGAKIVFDGLQHPQDKLKYQGLQYEFIGFDELTQFQLEEYEYLKSRNRANGPGMRTYIRATGNPGGVGHGWVKQYFVTAGEPNKTVWTKSTVEMPEGGVKTFWSSKVFIPSRVFDNKILLENDPEYLKKLAAMSEADRNALLYGDWNSFSGQVFTEFRDDPEHYKDRRNTHVIADFKIPSHWRIIRSLDWGFTKPFSVGWHAIDEDGRYYRIREYYGCLPDMPNTGVKMKADEVAKRIREIERNDINLHGKQITGVADPAIFADQGSGSTIASLFGKHGVYFNKGDNARLSGKMQYHSRLAFDEDGLPMYYVFKNCKDYIRTMPNLVYSLVNVEDIDTTGEDHIYDESRYAIMENQITPRRNVMQDHQLYDPLDVNHDLMRYII